MPPYDRQISCFINDNIMYSDKSISLALIWVTQWHWGKNLIFYYRFSIIQKILKVKFLAIKLLSWRATTALCVWEKKVSLTLCLFLYRGYFRYKREKIFPVEDQFPHTRTTWKSFFGWKLLKNDLWKPSSTSFKPIISRPFFVSLSLFMTYSVRRYCTVLYLWPFCFHHMGRVVKRK